MIALLLFTMLACMPGSPPVAGFPVTGVVDSNPSSKPQSTLDSLPTGCQMTFNTGMSAEDNFLWQICYDSLKYFIEHCAQEPYAHEAFSSMSDAVSKFTDTESITRYREWLESVMYLNTIDPEYFCAVVENIAFSKYDYPGYDTSLSIRLKAGNTALAILQWLIQNTNCDSAYVRSQYTKSRQSQYATWRNDTTILFDTTLPTMHYLGLDTLLAKHFLYAWVPSGGYFGKHVASYSVSENPLHSETTLRFALTDPEYVRVDVFDLLGNRFFTSPGRLLDAGNHEMPIDLSNAPSGSYFLRILLGTGEVRTIKLIRE